MKLVGLVAAKVGKFDGTEGRQRRVRAGFGVGLGLALVLGFAGCHKSP